MLKKIAILVSIFVFLGAGGVLAAAESQKTVTLKLGTLMSGEASINKGAYKFSEIVEQKTGGKIKVQVYPASQLGKADSQVEGLTMGTIDLFVDGLGWLDKFDDNLAILNVGFVFKDYNHLNKFMDSKFGKEITDKIEKKHGIMLLSNNWERAYRNIFSKKPIYKPQDLKGIKMRVTGQKGYVETWKGLGAVPTTVAWGEVYLALSQGMVDAMEGPITDVYSMKFHEQAPYCTLINYKPTSASPYMSVKSFKKLSPEYQKIVLDAAKAAGDFMTKVERERVSEVMAKMRAEGVKFIEVDPEDFGRIVLSGTPQRLEREGFWSKKGLFDEIMKLRN